MQVGGDPAHHVVRGGGDRHQLACHVDPRLAQRVDDVREQRGVDVAHVERRPTLAPVRSQQLLDRARDLVARRELVDEALAVGVEQPSPPRRGSPR